LLPSKEYAGLPLYNHEFPAIQLAFAERRHKPRLSYPCPALVRGVDCTGQPFEHRTTLIDISASGLCMVLPQRITIDSAALVIFRFSLREDADAPCIAVDTSVTRIQSHQEMGYRVAMVVQQHRFIWSEEWNRSFRPYFAPRETRPERGTNRLISSHPAGNTASNWGDVQ
jgi:c-di-GMP-binding flagellar brake protein YcgR